MTTEKIADFTVSILRTDNEKHFVLQAEGDEFEIEVNNPEDLIDEVEELVQERLAKYGIVVERN